MNGSKFDIINNPGPNCTIITEDPENLLILGPTPTIHIPYCFSFVLLMISEISFLYFNCPKEELWNILYETCIKTVSEWVRSIAWVARPNGTKQCTMLALYPLAILHRVRHHVI